MGIYLTTIAIIFTVMLAGIAVDRLYRAFAAKNPKLGPFRKPGCGSCSCHDGSCDAPPR
ncbi:MAG: hypothetical protein Q8O25_11970 [Sulfurisoma sp.]|nr:hypothetical protein [Sulfurisoma sp.]